MSLAWFQGRLLRESMIFWSTTAPWSLVDLHQRYLELGDDLLELNLLLHLLLDVLPDL